jgi:hypothetical protein
MMDPTYTGPKIEARGNLDSYVAPAPRELELDDKGGLMLLPAWICAFATPLVVWGILQL